MSRYARHGAVAAALAVGAGALVVASGEDAPAAERLPSTAAASVHYASDPVDLPVALPAKKHWSAAAERDKTTTRATRNAAPFAFGTIGYNKWYARNYMQQKYGWGEAEFAAVEQIWQRESGWDHQAHNPSSGAHGIPQSLPGNKMAMFGDDWATNPETQIKWGLHYIKGGYGSPSGALAFWNSHHWY